MHYLAYKAIMPDSMTGQPMEEILASIKRIIAEDAPLSLGPPTLGGDPRPTSGSDAEEVLELHSPSAPFGTVDSASGWEARAPLAPIDPLADPGPDPIFPEPALTIHEPREYFRGQPIVSVPAPDYVTSGAPLAPDPEPDSHPEAVVIPAMPEPAAHQPEPEPVSTPEAVSAPAVQFEPDHTFEPETSAAAGPAPVFESLLSAKAEAASREALAALNTLTVDSRAAPNTLDGLVREMLRPMIKDWLDNNLPALVEQLVAKEIKRLGRG